MKEEEAISLLIEKGYAINQEGLIYLIRNKRTSFQAKSGYEYKVRVNIPNEKQVRSGTEYFVLNANKLKWNKFHTTLKT